MILALLLLAALLALGAAVAVTVRNDGLGVREPPRSHPLDDAVPGRVGHPG